MCYKNIKTKQIRTKPNTINKKLNHGEKFKLSNGTRHSRHGILLSIRISRDVFNFDVGTMLFLFDVKTMGNPAIYNMVTINSVFLLS